MPRIDPDEVYTTNEIQSFLKISNSTMKRLLRRGLIRANKVGGQYRVMGKELLRILSPRIERKFVGAYQNMKTKVGHKIKKW